MWVGATGASLLLAAAAVLTAVRWGDIGQSAKLGGLVAITLALLGGGRRLQRSIPLTGRSLFHLGAMLIPLDMAAVAVLAERTWQEALLLTSLTAAVSWSALIRIDQSSVLQWAVRGAVVLVAAGVAAVTSLSMPLVLVAIAIIATQATVLSDGEEARVLAQTLGVSPKGRSATVWTLVAGLLPFAALQPWPIQLAGSVHDLGFGPDARAQMIGAGVLATLAAWMLARWRPSLDRAWLVVVLAVASAVTAAAMSSQSVVWAFCLAVFFLAAELVTLASRHDPIWKEICLIVAPIVEVIAGLGTAVVLVDAILVDASPALLTSAVVLALGWLTADRRRLREPSDWLVGLIYGADWRPATFLVPASTLAAVVAMPVPPVAASAVLVASAAWAVVTGRRDALVVGMLAGLCAVVLTPVGWHGVVIFVACALMFAVGARIALRERRNAVALLSGCFVAVSSVGLLIPLQGLVVDWAAMTTLAVAGWALGWVVSADVTEPAAVPARLVATLTLGATGLLDPVPSLLVIATVAGLAAFDAWRTRRWSPTVVTAVAIGLAGFPIGDLVGFSTAETGVMMTAASMVAVGLQIALPRRGELPLGALAMTLAGVGVAATIGTDLLAPGLQLLGGSIVLFGAANRCVPISGGGGLFIIIGTWMQLALWQVTWLEAYLALPALAALWAGSFWHRRGCSSWLTYAPTIALIGMVAVADRFGGGSAWHAVIAGGVGVFAVLAGGIWRLSGPLLTGTALIATIAVFESLGPGSRVPTWGWLALGGVVLLGAAVLMERAETTPLEQGQRVLNVLLTRFS